jgi:hypothetical protein
VPHHILKSRDTTLISLLSFNALPASKRSRNTCLTMASFPLVKLISPVPKPYCLFVQLTTISDSQKIVNSPTPAVRCCSLNHVDMLATAHIDLSHSTHGWSLIFLQRYGRPKHDALDNEQHWVIYSSKHNPEGPSRPVLYRNIYCGDVVSWTRRTGRHFKISRRTAA